ncbi:MAG: glycosyltransferase family 4 protein [Candidatus Dormibacteria bacterium]
MRILDVSPKDMTRLESGSAVRTYNLLSQLSRQHSVEQFSLEWAGRLPARSSTRTIVHTSTYLEHRYASPLAWSLATIPQHAWLGVPVASGATLRLARPAPLDALIRRADAILVEFPWQFEYCARRAAGAAMVLASHNVERFKFPSWARAARIEPQRSMWVRYIARAEANAVARADLIIAVSDSDRGEFIATYGVDPARVAVVPNGADTDLYVPADPPTKRDAKKRLDLPNRPTVIFAGADVPPNRDGLRTVCEAAARLPDVTFLVIGDVARPRRDGNLVFTGFVTDLRLHMQAADIALCPIQYGGGTKIKLLESLAAGLPTVVFEEALKGTAARPGEHVVAADRSADGVARAVQALISDTALAARIGADGRRLVVERYSWGQAARTLADALEARVR